MPLTCIRWCSSLVFLFLFFLLLLSRFALSFPLHIFYILSSPLLCCALLSFACPVLSPVFFLSSFNPSLLSSPLLSSPPSLRILFSPPPPSSLSAAPSAQFLSSVQFPGVSHTHTHTHTHTPCWESGPDDLVTQCPGIPNWGENNGDHKSMATGGSE